MKDETVTELTLRELGDRVMKLRIGQSFNVNTERERRDSLVAATVLGKRLVTKARANGGYTITALPE